jgi:hypothetical protein
MFTTDPGISKKKNIPLLMMTRKTFTIDGWLRHCLIFFGFCCPYNLYRIYSKKLNLDIN